MKRIYTVHIACLKKDSYASERAHCPSARYRTACAAPAPRDACRASEAVSGGAASLGHAKSTLALVLCQHSLCCMTGHLSGRCTMRPALQQSRVACQRLLAGAAPTMRAWSRVQKYSTR